MYLSVLDVLELGTSRRERSEIQAEKLLASRSLLDSCVLPEKVRKVYLDLSFIALRLRFTSVIGVGLPIGKLTTTFVEG
jgi:hypothetical protein